MRRLWVSLLVLAALLSAAACNTRYLNGFTEELAGILLEAEECVTAGDPEGGIQKTDEALQFWQSRETYLHMVLHHSDTDEILLAFQEVRQLLTHEENGGEYAAANAQLITRIRLLHEMEQFNLKNLL